MDTHMGSGREGTAGLASCLDLPQTLVVPLVLRHTHSHTFLITPQLLFSLPGHSLQFCPGLHTHASHKDRGDLIQLLRALILQWALKVHDASSDVIQNTV